MESLPRVTRQHVRIASAVLLVIGVAYTWDAFHLSLGDPIGTGSGAMPSVVGLLWVAFSGYLTAWPSEIAKYDEEVGTWPNRDMCTRIAIVLCLCFGLVLLLPRLGMVATSAIFMTLIGRVSGASWPTAIFSSLVLAASLWVLFVQVLGLSLPTGSWIALVFRN